MSRQLTLPVPHDTLCESCGVEDSFIHSGEFRCCKVCGWWEHNGDDLNEWLPVTDWINRTEGPSPARPDGRGRATTNRRQQETPSTDT